MDGGSDLLDALAGLEPVLLDDVYCVLAYERGCAPPSPPELAAEPLAVRVDDPDETTLVLRAVLADRLPEPALRMGGLRVILLAADAPPWLPGLASTVTGALADRGVPLHVVSTATRHHLLVPEQRWPEVLAILRGLRDAARQVAARPSDDDG